MEEYERLNYRRWKNEWNCARKVQLVLGHASAVITLRTCAYLWPGEEDRTRSVMDAVLGGLRTRCGQVGDTTRENAGQMA
ncbi:hypothetical protein SNA_34010 [Streptomyces natalensis ATCC 27448]|uniref:Integrase n=1 Tax=Streptomyces natalensis ATCC 27448 TaxID=1240678 RepID=A0A0D7CDM8_9ACTN|nr:hypothetical protein [Streptomyces natalensis]KIZ14136.1 hypothetical protein SNA_34010 [Streptomyces natalensis ATCC 27448]